jgi:hypothetical protein
MNTHHTPYDKLRISARYWLLGMAEHDKEYFKAYEALEYMLHHHTGLRNGGDPESIHQLRIFHSLRTQHAHLTRPRCQISTWLSS